MDYPCAKFGDFSFSRFGFIVHCRETDRITETRMIDILTRLRSAWVTTVIRRRNMLESLYKGGSLIRLTCLQLIDCVAYLLFYYSVFFVSRR